MKICMMTNTYLPHVGGVARSVSCFTECYRKLGNEVLVVAPTFPEMEEGKEETGVVRLPALQQFNGSDFSVRLPLTGLYHQKVSDFEANLIHSHHPFLLGDTALRLAAIKHVPVIFTHHTLYEEYTHYVPFDSPTLKQFAIELSTQYANLCDGVIAPSAGIAQLIQSRGVEVPVEVIPTGMNLGLFANGEGRAFRAAHGIPPGAMVIGHVGRLAPEKNLTYLAQAVAGLMQNHPKAVFLLVGGGPAEEEIRQVFVSANLTERLFMVGKKMGQDLSDAYAAMHLFAFASRSETQGMVVSEAMAAGLPVVALDATGVREVVRDGHNGVLLPAETSVSEFTCSLERMAGDTLLRKKLRAGARRTSQNFKQEHTAMRALDFYERIRRQTRRQRHAERDDTWSALVKRVEVEWELISEKAQAAFTALRSHQPERIDV